MRERGWFRPFFLRASGFMFGLSAEPSLALASICGCWLGLLFSAGQLFSMLLPSAGDLSVWRLSPHRPGFVCRLLPADCLGWGGASFGARGVVFPFELIDGGTASSPFHGWPPNRGATARNGKRSHALSPSCPSRLWVEVAGHAPLPGLSGRALLGP